MNGLQGLQGLPGLFTNMPTAATASADVGLNYQEMGQAGAAGNVNSQPLFGTNIQSQATVDDVLAKEIEVIGYISEKKNLLSKANDPKTIEQECQTLFNKFKAEGRPLDGDGFYIFDGKKKNKDGVIEPNGKKVKLTEKTKTISALLAVDEGAYNRVVEKQVYKVKLNELQPKYIILRNKEVKARFERGDMTEAFSYSSAALTLSGMKAIFNEEKSICIIDPVSLTKAQLSAGNRYLSVLNRENKKVGNISPSISTKTQSNKPKTVYTSIVTDNLTNTVKTIGYLHVPGFAHRSYEGQAVNPEKVLNEAEFKEYFPTASIKDLRIQAINPQTKGEKFAQKQEIEWKKLAPIAGALGVTEEMIKQLRGKKASSKTKSLSAADIEEKFKDAFAYYQQQQKSV